MTPKYDFFEKVLVSTTLKALSKVNGELGAVLGRAQDKEGKWNYAVHIYSKKESWNITESDLQSTGEFAAREDFYSGEKIRIQVNEKGQGTVAWE